jgi:hypothetical protein
VLEGNWQWESKWQDFSMQKCEARFCAKVFMEGILAGDSSSKQKHNITIKLYSSMIELVIAQLIRYLLSTLYFVFNHS